MDNPSNLNIRVLIILRLEITGDKCAASNRIGLRARGITMF